MRHVALVSRTGLPDWEKDDRALHAALGAHGVAWSQPAWSDPSVRWDAFDAALLRTTWDYHRHLDAFEAWARGTHARIPLWHGPDVIAWNARKTYLLDLRDAGVPLAPTTLVRPSAPETLRAALAGLRTAEAFLKPVVGSTAHDTLRFDAADADLAVAHLEQVGQPMLLQPFLSSVLTGGEHSVVVVDGTPTHAVVKRPVPGDYRVQDDWGATDAPRPLSDDLVAFAHATLRAAARRLGRADPFLYARVDVLELDGRWVLNELELIEPSLFFRHGAHAAVRLADAVVARLDRAAAARSA